MRLDFRQSIYQEVLSKTYGSDCQLIDAIPVSGGCSNNGLVLKSSQGKFFLKWNGGDVYDMFEKEMSGLDLLREHQLLTIPQPVVSGNIEDISYLLLEYIENGNKSPQFWIDFANKLGSIPAITSNQYGLNHHIYIGRFSQQNEWKRTGLIFSLKST